MRLRVGVVLTAVLALVVSGASSAADPAFDTELQVTSELVGPVMVELTGAPSAVVYANARKQGQSEAQAGNAAEARAAANEAAQDRVLAAIDTQDIAATPLYDVQTAYNGVAVQAEPGAADALAALPGVKALHAIPLVTLDNHSSVPLIGGPQAWSSFGKTGAGRTVAVIDTGVDYVHTGFRGTGSAADLAVATSAAANPPDPDLNPAGFSIPGVYPNAKVVGGFDFAGDAYNASAPAGNPALIPQPDPNPMDCNGHGTHVAGSAAGSGVNADGTAFTGSYSGLSNISSMAVGPGVAPEAAIYALRVFGCAGSTALTTVAIEWATDPNRDGNPADHVDVINMSLGSAFGTPDDPSAAASDNAVDAGVIVVTSAGNSGDTYYDSGSPGSAAKVLATASSLDAAERADAIVVQSPAAIAGTYIASRNTLYGWGTTATSVPETTGNVYYPATNQFGCSAWTGADAANISGRIVLVDWKIGNNAFPCGSAVRGGNAFAAGAIGIIMADSTTFLDTAIAGDARIPGMYTNVLVGNTFKSQLTPGVVNPAVIAKLSALVIGESNDDARIDALSGFSSRGPTTRSNGLKPDIAAPGQTIWSVASRTLNRGRSLNGTSMASPHMAGVMALLKQTRPTWTVEELKAVAMNTAAHDIFSQFNKTGPKYGPARVGAGRVDIPAALASTSLALIDDGSGSVSVSFGDLEVAGTVTRTKTIRVHNRGTSSQTYAIGYDERTSIPGVSYSFPDGSSLTVPAGSSRTFRVQLTANGAAMTNTRDATVAGEQTVVAASATAPAVILPRHWLSEASGLVTVTPAGGSALRVPVYANARPASTTSATLPFVNATGGTGSIGLEGAGVNTGAEPAGFQSKVSAFELGITSGLATLAAGIPSHARNGDVKYVGAARKGGWLYFGIAAHGEWSTPATDVQFNIQIDRNNDGTSDVAAFNTRLTFGANADPLDIFVNGVGSSAVSYVNIFDSNRTTAPYNNDVLVMQVPVTSLGLPAGQTAFRYRVVGQSRFFGTIDTTDWAKYDIDKPGISFSDGLTAPASIFLPAATAIPATPTTMYPDQNGQTIGVTFNAANFAANGSQGVLLLHHFGEGSQRTEVLPVASGTFALLALKGGACDNEALQLSGSGNKVTGNVHSNGGIKITGSKNTVSGAVTYRTGCRAQVKGLTATAAGLQADPLAHLTPAHFPCTFSRTGSWDLRGPLAPGVYCATGTIKLSDSKVSGDVTFVAERIELSGSNLNLTPNRLGVLAWATGTGDAVKVSGSNSTFGGIVYAPNGKAAFSGSDLTLGSIVAQTIKLSGSGSTAQG
jgi:subtilisin family serine protease